MPTYESIKYKFSGTAVTGVLQTASNLNDVAAKDTSRDNLGVEIGVDVQSFVSTTAGTSRTNLGVAIGSDVQGFFSASAGTNANGARTVSTNAPSGGSDGDIWYKYT